MMLGARGRGLLLAGVLAASFLGVTTPAYADAGAQGCSARAVVVVEPGPGPVTICFDGTISGLVALQLAGANPVTYGFAGQGAAVCQLYGVGNPADSSCLIGPGGQYWAYYRAGPGATGWTFSRAGASSTTVTDGSVEGWRYGTGAAPGFVSFCSVAGCASPPTDPPPATAATPPATGAPSATAPSATGGAPESSAPASGASDAKPGATASGVPGQGDDSASPAGTSAEAAPSTTGKGGHSASSDDRGHRSGTVEVAAGSAGGGGGGGSPAGVIVALVIVGAGVTGGLWLRRRRRGPASG
jgi:hypothetical protein